LLAKLAGKVAGFYHIIDLEHITRQIGPQGGIPLREDADMAAKVVQGIIADIPNKRSGCSSLMGSKTSYQSQL